jgi:4-amino-4-deoxy-L-arabinose transferase-like glycosyltransferase
MEKRNLVVLFLIVVVGAFLRFTLLTSNPPGLNWDEVSHGYNAYSILKTGMDQWGQKFPIVNFRAYGDYPTTLNLYLTIPFIAVFGLTEFAIRFPHAIMGVFTIISVYFLSFGIAKKTNMSLLAAFLVAVEPWYLFTSRFVLQSNLSVFFLITAAAFFVNRDKNKLFFPFSLLFLTFTLFSYHTTRIFSPLFLLSALLLYRDEIKNKFVYIFAGLFIALSAFILFNPSATARGNFLFILDQSAINKINESRNLSTLPTVVSKLLYNKPVYFIEQFSKKYVSYFSPQFLFLNGGTQYQFSVPGFGLIYPISLPFFYIGFVFLVYKSLKDRNYRMLLLWLILSPIPASLTNESYTVLRATTILPLPEILISLGFYFLIDKILSKFRLFVTIIFIIVLLASLENYLTNYFTEYRSNYSWSWQYGYKEVTDYVKDHYQNYDSVIVTKKYAEPHEFFLFFLRYDPLKYLNDSNRIAFYQSNWYWVDHFDKFWFVNDWQVKLNSPEMSSIQNYFVTESKQRIDCLNKKCLLIASPDNFPPGWIRLKAINFLDGKPAFEILTNSK